MAQSWHLDLVFTRFLPASSPATSTSRLGAIAGDLAPVAWTTSSGSAATSGSRLHRSRLHRLWAVLRRKQGAVYESPIHSTCVAEGCVEVLNLKLPKLGLGLGAGVV